MEIGKNITQDTQIVSTMKNSLKCSKCNTDLVMTFGSGRFIATMRSYCPCCDVSHWATTEEVFWFGVKYGLSLK